MHDSALLEVSLAHTFYGDLAGLKTELAHLTTSLNLNPEIITLLVLAAENDWCPIATLHSAGHLQLMSSWQIFNLFSQCISHHFTLIVHSLLESTGYAVIHQSNGNCVIGDAEGNVDIQVISPLEVGFIHYLATTHSWQNNR